MLNKQVFIYSVDTSDFYNAEEKEIHNQLSELHFSRSKLKKRSNKSKDDNLKKEISQELKTQNAKVKELKGNLITLFKKNKVTRSLNPESLKDKNVVACFESTLTRTLEMEINSVTKDIIIVQVYFFDVCKDIILNGFTLNDEKYVFFTASAGQIRKKKVVFIKEDVLMKYEKTLMCGLTIEDINKAGGVNINKFIAYRALINSATDEWDNFNIDRAIVVEDFESSVNGIVDHIDYETYKITRKEMDVPITHTDGCGMILSCKSKKSFMVRLPWIKGLLVPFPFDEFIKDGNTKVVDIYGKEWDVIDDKIEIIFTKSQFKMYKYYKNWKHYTDCYKKYCCQSGICNLEEDTFKNAKFNYQMLQTLIDMTDSELETITQASRDNIKKITKDKRIMLKLLGVTKHNQNKNYMQQALEIYPHLLADVYNKSILNQTKKSLVKEAKAGRLELESTYTFICPDLYAFCDFLFNGNKTPLGLLKNGEVSCKIYRNVDKLDCLRSPSLYLEHPVRKNIIDDEINKWFVTNGLYTSCHDLISKTLQFDVDGDKSLVCADKTIVEVAERSMKDIVPLYYEMKKAGVELITNENIYKSLVLAWKGGNIGVISNNITKVWNSDDINLDVVKWLCMENNFTIDYAKTLYKTTRPEHIHSIITQYTKTKVPHFFYYAKDKSKKMVEDINNNVVNKLNKIIIDHRVDINKFNLGRFDYRKLIGRKYSYVDQKVIDKYTELDLKKYMMIDHKNKHANEYIYAYTKIRNDILEVNNDIEHVVYSLVNYLYGEKKTNNKITLWNSFGDVLVSNLKANVKVKFINCRECGDVIEKISNRKYCKKCAKKINIFKTMERKRCKV